jgi:hypothetical protein
VPTVSLTMPYTNEEELWFQQLNQQFDEAFK